MCHRVPRAPRRYPFTSSAAIHYAPPSAAHPRHALVQLTGIAASIRHALSTLARARRELRCALVGRRFVNRSRDGSTGPTRRDRSRDRRSASATASLAGRNVAYRRRPALASLPKPGSPFRCTAKAEPYANDHPHFGFDASSTRLRRDLAGTLDDNAASRAPDCKRKARSRNARFGDRPDMRSHAARTSRSAAVGLRLARRELAGGRSSTQNSRSLASPPLGAQFALQFRIFVDSSVVAAPRSAVKIFAR